MHPDTGAETEVAFCARCWRDAYVRMMDDPTRSQAEHYRDLLEERASSPCTFSPHPPRRRGGLMPKFYDTCAHCGQDTLLAGVCEFPPCAMYGHIAEGWGESPEDETVWCCPNVGTDAHEGCDCEVCQPGRRTVPRRYYAKLSLREV